MINTTRSRHGHPAWHVIALCALMAVCATILSAQTPTQDTPDPAASDTVTLTGTYWRLDRLMGADVPTGQEPHIMLRTAPPARFGVTVGCNQFMGGYETGGDRLRFIAVASTRMACTGALGLAETRLKTALARTAAFNLTGNRLVLRAQDGTVLANLTALRPE